MSTPHNTATQKENPSPATPSTTIMAALLLSAILPLLDSSMVNVAVPTIGEEFRVEAAQVQLTVSGYMLAATIGIALSATATRRLSSRTTWLISVSAFVIASLLCGLAPNLMALVIFRVVQGLACGFIMPAVQSLLVDMVGPAGMRAALATIGLPAVVAPAFGPLFGGAIIAAVGWRWMFFINIPLGLAAIALAWRSVPTAKRSPDPVGPLQIFSASLGLAALLWAVSAHNPWWALAALAALLIYIRLDLRADHPLLGMRLYANQAFSAVMGLCLVIGAVFYGTLLATVLQIEEWFEADPIKVGLLLAIQGAGAWISRSLVKGPLAKVPAIPIIGGGLIAIGVGTAILALPAAHPLGPTLLIGHLIRGLGAGAGTVVALAAAFEVAPQAEAASASAHTRVMLQLGGALGAAGVGVWSASAVGLATLIASGSLLIGIVTLILFQFSKR